MKLPAVLQKIKAQSLDPSFGSRADAAKFVADESALWNKVAMAANIKPTH
jgi:hypothetical protein